MFPINPKDARPIYEQIIERIKEQVIKGMLMPGDKLPSVRELAHKLTVNANTVMKAYTELERQEVVETIRGKGVFIAQMQNKIISQKKLEEIRNDLKANCIALHYMGMDKETIIKEVSTIYDKLLEEE